MESGKVFQIDFDNIIREKTSNVKIPAFIISFIRGIVKVDELNAALKAGAPAEGVDLMEEFISYFNIDIKTTGLEKIPMDGRLIFASNHPLGGLDGICLSALIGRIFDKKIKYLVNDILYFVKPLQRIFVPVNKLGGQSRRGIQLIEEAFASDNQIITFPAGLCSRKGNGQIRDIPWKKMFISKAVQYKRDIVPVFFEGKNSDFFYNLAKIRKFFHIKFNVEMMFLPGEMLKQKGSSFKIHFLDPIPWEKIADGQSPAKWAAEIENRVYNYQKGNDGKYNF